MKVQYIYRVYAFILQWLLNHTWLLISIESGSSIPIHPVSSVVLIVCFFHAGDQGEKGDKGPKGYGLTGFTGDQGQKGNFS